MSGREFAKPAAVSRSLKHGLSSAHLIPSRLRLHKPVPLNIDDFLIQHALDLVLFDETGKRLLGADQLPRRRAAARDAGSVESISRLLRALVEPAELIRATRGGGLQPADQ